MLDFEGRVYVVTGGGRGMGRSHATELARRGARVVVNDLGGDMVGGASTDTTVAEEAVRAIVDAGGTAVASTDSVATAEGCDGIVETAMDTYGRLDGVLHNAGITTYVPLAETSEAEFERIMRVNLYGAFNLTRAAWPHMAAGGGGRFLYISSGAGLYGSPTLGHYAAAKVGMLGLARVASQEGLEFGISANVLAVAAYTRMMDKVLRPTPNLQGWFRDHVRPELVSGAAVWLLHPDCPANGRTYESFGGHVARVLLTETRGYTSLELTPEAVRDNFSQIENADDTVEFAGPVDFHDFMYQSIIDAGAPRPEPDDGTPGPMADNIGQGHRVDDAVVS